MLVAIALWASGPLRTHGGDVLVVAWLYAGIRMVMMWSGAVSAVIVFLVALLIEVGQAADFVERIGLQETAATQLTLGSTFDPIDLIAYALGASGAYLIDRTFVRRDVS